MPCIAIFHVIHFLYQRLKKADFVAMENHPIPQDVTGFQFKLIGNMTIKQFAFLAAGGVATALIIYMPVFILFKLILAPLFAGAGLVVAFVPIEGRSVDVMISHFFQAALSPNQYLYHKMGRQYAIFTIAPTSTPVARTTHTAPEDKTRAQNLQFLLSQSHPKAKNKMDEKENAFLSSLSKIAAGQSPQIVSMQNEVDDKIRETANTSVPDEELQAPQPAQIDTKQAEELEKEEVLLKQELAAAKTEEQQEQQAHQDATVAHQKSVDLEKQLTDLMSQKQQLEEEFIKLKRQLEEQQRQPIYSPQVMQKQEEPHIRRVPASMAQSVGLPNIPDVPNVIIGIIKDPRGNVLPNILVEIKDREGNPVRAFKTNPLGQFSAATALNNGIYTIVFEDPKKQQSFDSVELVVNGSVLLPIEVISHDAREELRKALFN